MDLAGAVPITAPQALPFILFIIFQKLQNITSSFQSPPQISTVTAVTVRYLKGVYKFMG